MKPREAILALVNDHAVLNHREVAAKLGRDLTPTLLLMWRMHADGLLHVARWVRGGDGPAQPQFACGAGKDAVRPTPLTKAEIARRHRQRLARERPEVAEQRRQATLLKKRKTPLFSDPVTAAFFGYRKVRKAWVKTSNHPGAQA